MLKSSRKLTPGVSSAGRVPISSMFRWCVWGGALCTVTHTSCWFDLLPFKCELGPGHLKPPPNGEETRSDRPAGRQNCWQQLDVGHTSAEC